MGTVKTEANLTKDEHRVYQFAGLAVTECHKLKGLKQQNFPLTILVVRSLESSCQQRVFSL